MDTLQAGFFVCGQQPLGRCVDRKSLHAPNLGSCFTDFGRSHGNKKGISFIQNEIINTVIYVSYGYHLHVIIGQNGIGEQASAEKSDNLL
ncbi:MAG: hypothetical protein JW944_02890 [Deltaproteobacteria bacterium]|nr:hypothetical protein [Deltaproteobacteria bacterium]